MLEQILLKVRTVLGGSKKCTAVVHAASANKERSAAPSRSQQSQKQRRQATATDRAKATPTAIQRGHGYRLSCLGRSLLGGRYGPHFEDEMTADLSALEKGRDKTENRLSRYHESHSPSDHRTNRDHPGDGSPGKRGRDREGEV